MRTRIAPLFKWTGSKQRMLHLYAPHVFPETAPTRFVDLFAGALTMTLWMAETYPSCALVINDANAELILLYRTLAANAPLVIAQWQECVDAWLSRDVAARKSYYYELREIYCHAHHDKPPAYLSGMLLFMLSVNFNGLWRARNKYAKRYSTAPGMCTQGPAFFTTIENILAVAKILQRAEIHCGAYAEVPVQPGDYIYADPPYRNASIDYQGGFGEEDHRRLAQYLVAHDGIYAYSNSNTDHDKADAFYTTHLPTAQTHVFAATYALGGTSVRTSEVLITNFNSPHALSPLVE